MKTHGLKKEYGDILRLALPVVLTQMGQVLVQLVDNAMVGHLGALPLAAVSFANSVFFMVFVLGIGLSLGLTPLVGEVYSQRNYRTSAHLLQNSILLFGIMGIALTGVAFGIIPLMHHMGQPEDVVEMAIPFYKYISWSLVPFMLFAAFKQFLEGVGNTKVAMVIVITSNVVNVCCNWVFIYGNLGVEPMGAAGAGLGTLIARIITPVMIILYFYKRDSFNRYFSFFSLKDFSWGRISSLVKVGSPIAFQMFMEGLAFVAAGIMMGWIGTVEIASNQVATVISNFAFMILIGISSSVTICVSHAYGRRNRVEIKRYASAGYRLGLMWNGITALLFITLRNYIPQIFTSDPQVIEMASNFLIFVAIFQISDGLQANSIGILRGIQDVKSIMVIAFISYILICLPVGYLLAFKTSVGPSGLWLGLTIGLGLAAILLNSRYRKQLKIDN
jgi:MATE family multidrug resistance protein